MWLSIARVVRKLWFQLGRERFKRELAEEIAVHQELKFREHTMAGLSSRQAGTQTRLEMGNITLAAEESADVRSFVSLEQLVEDIRYALRLVRKNFAFSLVAILSLALGIAATLPYSAC